MSAGDSGDRIEAIISQISSWAAQGNYEVASGLDVDRALADVFRNPDKFIDATLSASANWEIIKDEIGIRTQGSIEELLADADQMQRERVREEIRAQFDEYGIETVTDALVDNPVPEDLRQRVDDVLDEFPPDVYDAIIREEVGVILDVLGDDFRVIETDRLEELRQAAERGDVTTAAREDVLQRLSQAFGQRFTDVDEAVRTLQERIAAARGERLRIAPIIARRTGDTVRIQIADGDEFDEFEALVRRRARRAIAFPPDGPTTNTSIGEVRVRGGELELIDLEAGVDRFGAAEEMEDVPVREEFETSQGRLVEPTEEAGDVIARRAIQLLRRA